MTIVVIQTNEDENAMLKRLYQSPKGASIKWQKTIETLRSKGLVEYNRVTIKNQLTRFGEQFTHKLLKSLDYNV